MTSLAQHQSNATTKLLLIGDSGTGKTGALASLAKAGYNLYIVDMDNGLDILANLLADDKEALGRVEYTTCTDKFKPVGGRQICTQATAFPTAMKMLTEYSQKAMEPGKDVLVLDSMTFLGKAALNYICALGGRPFGGQQAPYQSDWGEAMRLVENVLAMLYSDSVSSNVIVTSHVTYIEDETGAAVKGYPSALGKKLPPTVGRYFNAMMQVKRKGSGTKEHRIIRTVSEGLLDLKNPAPGKVPTELPLENGLAEYFKLVRKVATTNEGDK